jgi:hypothetical protein
MSYIYYNAIHEAGHAVTALCYKCDIEKIFLNDALLLTTQWTFHSGKTPPFIPYAVQLAGSIAVQIQNEKFNRSDDDGFGISDETGSDANWVASICAYLKRMGMTNDWIADTDKRLRQIVHQLLHQHWDVVEAIARETEKIVPSARPILGANLPELSATEIGKAIESVDKTFYEQVIALLKSGA